MSCTIVLKLEKIDGGNRSFLAYNSVIYACRLYSQIHFTSKSSF